MFDDIATPSLGDRLVGLGSRLAAGHCEFLLLLTEFDRREGWAGPGIRSCGHWLSWQLGMSPRTSRDHLRVGRALVGLPLIVEAFSAGRLSYAKVRAITRVATPDTEKQLLDLALAATASQVERAARAIRRNLTPAAVATAERAVSWRWDEDGYLVLRAKLPPEDGARLVAALHARLDDPDGSVDSPAIPAPRRSLEDPEHSPTSQRTAGIEHEPGTATDRLAARRADALLDLLAADVGQHQVVVHLDLGDGTATLGEQQLPLAAATAERLACNPRVRTLIRKQGNPLYLGRSHRRATNAQLTALLLRDRHCQFPGCDHRQFLHAHHVVHWLHGGATDLDNLVLLCAFHHRLVHDQGYRGVLDGGRFRLWRPDGTTVTAQAPPRHNAFATTFTDRLVETHAELLGRTVADDAIVPTWSGERLDLDALLFSVGSHLSRTRSPAEANIGT